MDPTALLAAFNALLLAIVAFFLKQTWDEIKSLRVSRLEHGELLAKHTAQIFSLDDNVSRLRDKLVE